MSNTPVTVTRESSIADLVTALESSGALTKQKLNVLKIGLKEHDGAISYRGRTYATVGQLLADGAGARRAIAFIPGLAKISSDSIFNFLQSQGLTEDGVTLTEASTIRDLATALIGKGSQQYTAIGHTLESQYLNGIPGFLGKNYTTVGELVADEADARLSIAALPRMQRALTNILFNFIAEQGITSQKQRS